MQHASDDRHRPQHGALGGALAVLAMAVFALGCSQSPTSKTGTGATTGSPDGGVADMRPVPGPGALPGSSGIAGTGDPLRQAWTLLGQWDAAQSAGHVSVAAKTAQDLQRTVDGSFPTFVSASQGKARASEQGQVELQYLATSVLGFSARPEATRVIEQRLGDRDPNLVANALVALSIRKDPATNLPLVLRWADQRAPALPRRYAPLVVSNVIEAQHAAGQPRNPRVEGDAMRRVSTLVSDQSAVTRMHVAKALGSVRNPGTTDYLIALVGDRESRVRLAAAAGLERSGDIRGFGEVIRLLYETPPGSQRMIQDILVSYAGRISGKPLTAAEVQSLGTNAAQWSRWEAELQRTRGIRTAPSRS